MMRMMGTQEVMLSGGTVSWQAPVCQQDISLNRIIELLNLEKTTKIK